MFFGGPGEVKTGFSLERVTNFDNFGSCNISWLLNPRFWGRFGGQDGHQIRTFWLQEGNMGNDTRIAKTMKKLKGPKIGWKWKTDRPTTEYPPHLDPRGGNIGRGKPLPLGMD